MTDKEKLDMAILVMREIEDTASCAVGLHEDNMLDALREIQTLARQFMANVRE